MRLFFAAVVGVVGLSGAWLMGDAVEAAASWFEPTIIEKLVPVEVQKKERTLKELLDNPPAECHSLPREILEALVAGEDDGNGKAAVRFEEDSDDWLKRAQRITPNKEQQQMYRRSYGPFQVAGWWAPEYGMTWVDLLDIETNMAMACLVFQKGWDRRSHNQDSALTAAFRRYNGAGPKAEAYTTKRMAFMRDRVFSKWLASTL